MTQTACAASSGLQKGTTWSAANGSELAESSIPYGVSGSGQDQFKDSGVSAFLVPPEGSVVYSLSDKLALYATPYPSGGTAKRWPLDRWPIETGDVKVERFYDVRDSLIREEWDAYGQERSDDHESLGCLADTPLRYGDVDGTGSKKLVLALGYEGRQLDWAIFSPASGRILFSARLAQQDAVKQDDEDLALAIRENASENYLIQYTYTEFGATRGPGLKRFAKFYFGDFDANGHPDILVWRKGYVSRLYSDPLHGFKLVAQLFRHYELSSNGYQQQPTSEADVRNWLSSRQLTWSKGYPSKSECPGHESELIPEMHDPLLNDPEVLQ